MCECAVRGRQAAAPGLRGLQHAGGGAGAGRRGPGGPACQLLPHAPAGSPRSMFLVDVMRGGVGVCRLTRPRRWDVCRGHALSDHCTRASALVPGGPACQLLPLAPARAA